MQSAKDAIYFLSATNGITSKEKKYLKIELMLTFVIKTENTYKYLENYQPVNILNVVSAFPGENTEGVI